MKECVLRQRFICKLHEIEPTIATSEIHGVCEQRLPRADLQHYISAICVLFLLRDITATVSMDGCKHLDVAGKQGRCGKKWGIVCQRIQLTFVLRLKRETSDLLV